MPTVCDNEKSDYIYCVYKCIGCFSVYEKHDFFGNGCSRIIGAIQIFNYGNYRHDFTYVDANVEGVVRVMKKASNLKTGADGLPIIAYSIYNIGGGQHENLLDFV